jgi:hypothetical protein
MNVANFEKMKKYEKLFFILVFLKKDINNWKQKKIFWLV